MVAKCKSEVEKKVQNFVCTEHPKCWVLKSEPCNIILTILSATKACVKCKHTWKPSCFNCWKRDRAVHICSFSGGLALQTFSGFLKCIFRRSISTTPSGCIRFSSSYFQVTVQCFYLGSPAIVPSYTDWLTVFFSFVQHCRWLCFLQKRTPPASQNHLEATQIRLHF